MASQHAPLFILDLVKPLVMSSVLQQGVTIHRSRKEPSTVLQGWMDGYRGAHQGDG